MTTPMTPEESNIRAECRRQVRAKEGADNPYSLGTMEALTWESELTRLEIAKLVPMP